MAAPAPQAAASTAPAGSIDLNATLNALLNNPNLSPEDRANMASVVHSLREGIQTGRVDPKMIAAQLHSQAGIQRLLASGAVPRPAAAAGPSAPAVAPASASTPAPPAAATTPDVSPFLSQGINRPIYTLQEVPASGAQSDPVAWPLAQQGRPTLTGGVAGGRIAGTPLAVEQTNNDLAAILADGSRSRRKNTPGDQSMRRSIQDLVLSIDPNVRIDADVEDLLMEIADEFIDSVTNFGCRLAKHRGAETLEVRDLQLHLERNHDIRIPGFASDETRFAASQTGAAAGAGAKKAGGGTGMTLRSQRLQQVQQAKRDGKLL